MATWCGEGPAAMTATGALDAPAGPGDGGGPRTGAADRRALVRVSAARRLGRRRRWGIAGRGACLLALVGALVPLAALIAYAVARGAHVLSIGFLTHDPTPAGVPGGGIANAIIGTLTLVGMACVMAVPVGLAAALFLLERQGRLARWLRFGAGVMAGIPSIIIGMFAWVVLVDHVLHQPSTLAGEIALATLMLPIMVRANEEAMRKVPIDLWEAGVALGAQRGRVARSVILRNAAPGLVTGNLLAIARAVGETAPLLFVLANTNALSLLIFQDATSPFPATQQAAWGAALVLVAMVLVLNIVARLVAARLVARAR